MKPRRGFKLMAKNTVLHASTAKRLRTSAESAADSYARTMKKALQAPAKKLPGPREPNFL